MDTHLFLSPSRNLLNRCLLRRTYQSLYYTNGTTLRLALCGVPAIPSRSEPQMDTTITARHCPLRWPLPLPVSISPPFLLLPRMTSQVICLIEPELQSPSHLDLIVYLLFPYLVGKHQKNQTAPFLLAHLLVSPPSEPLLMLCPLPRMPFLST